MVYCCRLSDGISKNAPEPILKMLNMPEPKKVGML